MLPLGPTSKKKNLENICMIYLPFDFNFSYRGMLSTVQYKRYQTYKRLDFINCHLCHPQGQRPQNGPPFGQILWQNRSATRIRPPRCHRWAPWLSRCIGRLRSRPPPTDRPRSLPVSWQRCRCIPASANLWKVGFRYILPQWGLSLFSFMSASLSEHLTSSTDQIIFPSFLNVTAQPETWKVRIPNVGIESIYF